MASELSNLESATKYLSPTDKGRFFKIKRDMEASGASRKNIEERLRAFLWDVVESDDDDDENEDDAL
ncbi:hypothetical protein [Pseudochrobactrum sp. B5]|uniref:hypothetical protein n=1 Tax=Pseudochrobactrum sp. B5 TaxID=1289478 RepID=UPI000951E61D|nr:hypothetical protein [Pseudochrobactrum sp. B5]